VSPTVAGQNPADGCLLNAKAFPQRPTAYTSANAPYLAHISLGQLGRILAFTLDGREQTQAVGMDHIPTAAHVFQVHRSVVSLYAILMIRLVPIWAIPNERLRDQTMNAMGGILQGQRQVSVSVEAGPQDSTDTNTSTRLGPSHPAM
jgi:hypothetical protein